MELEQNGGIYVGKLDRKNVEIENKTCWEEIRERTCWKVWGRRGRNGSGVALPYSGRYGRRGLFTPEAASVRKHELTSAVRAKGQKVQLRGGQVQNGASCTGGSSRLHWRDETQDDEKEGSAADANKGKGKKGKRKRTGRKVGRQGKEKDASEKDWKERSVTKHERRGREGMERKGGRQKKR